MVDIIAILAVIGLTILAFIIGKSVGIKEVEEVIKKDEEDKKIGTYYLNGKLLKKFAEHIIEEEQKNNEMITVDVYEVVYLEGNTLGFQINKQKE